MKIGNVDVNCAVALAPMEDVTDISFRLICKRLGADIVYTEFVNSEGLVRRSEKTHRKLYFLEEERPFGIQLYGGEESSMSRAAMTVEELRPDIIDINCGCWVKKVAGRGEGAGLLRDLDKMAKLIKAVVNAVKIPVTVKTRLGWDSSSIRIVEVAKMVEDCGARALTVHCRTREQGHKGAPDYSRIPQIKACVSIPIIVNGGIDTAAKGVDVFQSTGCDGIMIAQGAIYNPWIFGQIKSLLNAGVELPEPTFGDRLRLMIEHLRLAMYYKGERRGIFEFRKHYSGYLRNYPGISKIRSHLMEFTEAEPLLAYLHTLPHDPAVQEAATVGVLTDTQSS